jgi:hypothetical protein
MKTPREYEENTNETRSEYVGNALATRQQRPCNALSSRYHRACAWPAVPGRRRGGLRVSRNPKAERMQINPGGNRVARLEDFWRLEVPWIAPYVELGYDPFPVS